MNKKIVAVLSLMFVMTCALFAQSKKDVEIGGFKMTIPSDWLTIEGKDALKWTVLSPDGMYNGNLVVETLPATMTVEEYLEATRDLLESAYEVNFTEKGKDYHIIDLAMQGIVVREIQFVQIRGKDVYVVTFGTLKDNFNKSLDTFKSIYRSLKF